MSWFCSPKCPKCGGKLRIVSRPLMDSYRCDNCVEKSQQKKKIENLQMQMIELRKQLKDNK